MILVTGFGPYKEKINASGKLIASLNNDLPDELGHLKPELHFEVIACKDASRETQHMYLEEQLKVLLQKHNPEICLFTGQAPSYNKITIEKVAINSFLGETIDPVRPVGFWSDIPGLDTLISELEGNDIPAAYSFYAGQHLCNHILYSSLYFAGSQTKPHRSGFVHIPVLPEQTINHHPDSPSMALDVSRKALSIVINHIAQEAMHSCHFQPAPKDAQIK